MNSMERTVLDDMRQLARKTAALTRAAEDVLDYVHVGDAESRQHLEDLGHLLDSATETATTINDVGLQLSRDVCSNCRRRRA